MRRECTIKWAPIDFHRVPRALWRLIKKQLPRQRRGGVGRPPIGHRAVLNGLWYVLWTGCQWKAVHRRWFGVSSSVLHARFQQWQRAGIWARILRAVARYYARQRRIAWTWQALDSKSVAAPLGGAETGPNPTDRAKSGSKIHLWVDARGAPLAVSISGANRHDKWAVAPLLDGLVVRRPTQRQHLCADKGYDYPDVEAIVVAANFIPHIKRRRRRGEPEPAPRESAAPHPARRWVVERTLSWLTKRRSLRTRWCKNPHNWLAFVQFASAHILWRLAISG